MIQDRLRGRRAACTLEALRCGKLGNLPYEGGPALLIAPTPGPVLLSRAFANVIAAMGQPSVTQLRATFEPESKRRSMGLGLMLFCGVALACLTPFLAIPFSTPLLSKVALGVLLGIGISAFFVIGHDACHDSLTPSHRLNQVLGRLCFLPTLHPYVSWELGHNRLHHGWTNLKGMDYVYTPFSPDEFRALPAWRRGLEIIYRTVPGIALFYLIEIWWKHMVAPRATDFTKLRRNAYALDLAWVILFFGAETCIAFALSPNARTGWINFACAVLVPYAVWNWLMAFVTIQHHTHPQAPWFKDIKEWSFFHGQIHGTIHLRLPRWIELLFHNILDHTAHHVDPKIPLYNLPQSQRRLEQVYPQDVLIMQGSIPALWRVLRVCKLYDYEHHRWLDFRGRPTAPPIPLHRCELESKMESAVV